MKVRRSTLDDLEVLMALYGESLEIMLESGNLHQWKPGYPSEELVRRDIMNGNSYCIVESSSKDGVSGAETDKIGANAGKSSCEADGRQKIVGAFSFIPGEDPTYKVIKGGQWIDDTKPYGTIHRLGSFKSSKGVAETCFEWCWSQIHNLRVDTHVDNAIMRHCIEKAGFKYCGIINILSGDERLAFQKI